LCGYGSENGESDIMTFNMKTAGKGFIIFSTAALALWIVPWICAIITAKPFSAPFTMYSPILHDFTYIDRSGGKALKLIDSKGNVHGDEVQPLFYYMVLTGRGALPKEIEGHKITPELVKKYRYSMSEKPQYVNAKPAPAQLLMESVPVRLELQDPEHAMIFHKDGLHIYEMNSNSEDKAKTEAFTKALAEIGFSFPAKLTSGNPTHRKEFDEGYLLTDSAGRLYQLKMTDGRPEARHFSSADGISIKYISIVEISSREILGYVVDNDNVFYVLRPSGELIKTEAVWNPQKENLYISGDLLYHTIKASDSDGERIYALRTSDFSFENKMERRYDKPQSFNICRWVLPFRLYFVSGNDSYVKPRIKDFSWAGTIVSILAITGIIFWRRKHGN
jgi:hypothetical protein